jgi:histone H4
MARLPGSTQPPSLGKIAPGLGGKGLGKSTAKRHRNVLRAGCSGALLGQGPSRDGRTYASESCVV